MAARARRHSGLTLPTLSAVEVGAERPRGFRGSTNYCVATRFVRSWSTDNDGLIVEVSPRRAAGNRYYRVELQGTCDMLNRAPSITLTSGVGTGIVCGYPGDKVELAGADESSELTSAAARRRWVEIEKFCNVLAVYPIRKDQASK